MSPSTSGLLRRIHQSEKLSNIKSPQDLIAPDFKSKEIFLPYSKIETALMGSSPQVAASLLGDSLTILADSGKIALIDCDQIYNKFNKCLEVLEENNLKQNFEPFHPTTECLDDFLDDII
ncbi:hypothetical protein BgiMline_021365 [Biomphalaria glabrata]|nr:hypothetical protein BgiMline_032005 [Biomphalaria glabrata]